VKHQAITFASAAFFVTSLALASDIWILDSSKSNARLFQGSRTNPDPANTGVARVTGKVKLDANDLDASFFDLTIYPADEDWWGALSHNGALPNGCLPDATDHTLLTFKSTHILSTENGKLEVIGDLTLTRVKRTARATPPEARGGPVHGDPVIHNEIREITFLFPSMSTAYLSEPLTATMTQKKGVLEIVGAARVDREESPEPLSTMKETNRPPIVQSQDYSFPQYAPATGNQTTIVLDLEFLHKVPQPSAEAHSGTQSSWTAAPADQQIKLTKAT